MMIDFVQVGLIFGVWVLVTGILLLFARESKKGARMLWVFVVSSLILAVLWYLSYDGTIHLCNLLKCGV